MARYRGPKTKIARRFKEPIFGPDKALEKRSYGPGQHGPNKRRGKQSEYAIQLGEKQKAKYTISLIFALRDASIFLHGSRTMNPVLGQRPSAVRYCIKTLPTNKNRWRARPRCNFVLVGVQH